MFPKQQSRERGTSYMYIIGKTRIIEYSGPQAAFGDQI